MGRGSGRSGVSRQVDLQGGGPAGPGQLSVWTLASSLVYGDQGQAPQAKVCRHKQGGQPACSQHRALPSESFAAHRASVLSVRYSRAAWGSKLHMM